MNIIRKIDSGLSYVFKLITAAGLFVQMTIIFVGVVARYFLNNPMPWVDELSTYLLIVVTYLGGYVALREDKLASITFLRDSLPRAIRTVVVVVGNLMIVAFLAAVTYYGYKLGGSPTILNQKTPTMQLPVIVFFCLVPVSSLLMLFSMLLKTVDALTGKEQQPIEKGAYTE